MTHERNYLKTHPWITFTVNLELLSHKTWMALGEAQSKCIHLAGVPLKPSVQEDLHQVALIKGAAATTAIEGNTLTEEEIKRQIKGELSLPPSKEYLKQETQNILDLFSEINKEIRDKKTVTPPLSLERLSHFNKKILENVPVDECVIPGKIRTYPSRVGRYVCPPHEDCAYLCARMCEWINNEIQAQPGMEIAIGLIKAVLAHLYFVWIHPFGDGNGRTARLIEYQILLKVGVPSPAAHLLSNHYNQTRNTYYRKLDEASTSPHGVLRFLEYAIEGFIEGMKELLRTVRFYQWDAAWINYVHEQFSGKNTEADARKRNLVLAITEAKGWVPVSDLRHLNPKLAELYAKRTQRMVYRDIEDLKEMGLIVRGVNSNKVPSVTANKVTILAFLPIHTTEIFDKLFE